MEANLQVWVAFEVERKPRLLTSDRKQSFFCKLSSVLYKAGTWRLEEQTSRKETEGKVVSSLVSFKYLPCFFLLFVRSLARSARPLMSSKGLLSVLLGHPVSSAEAFLCRGEAGEREKESAWETMGRGKG